MSQNFKRRISLFPNSLSKFQNSIKERKDLADIDTFNKKIINKNTPPKKEKKMKLSLLQTPIIEKNKLRKISIYSPISFCDIPTPITNYENFRKKEININKKLISNFNINMLPEEEKDMNDIININMTSMLPKGKVKKINCDYRKGINNNKNITLVNKDNKQVSFKLYNDKDIYGKNDIIKECDLNNIDNKTEQNSDDEEIQSKCNKCFFELNNAFDFIEKSPNFLMDKIKYGNKSM